MTEGSLVHEPVAKAGSFELALDRVSLTIAPGEKVGLFGENGAGKSTLMKILYGFQRADSGTIDLDGKPIVIALPSDGMNFFVKGFVGTLH